MDGKISTGALRKAAEIMRKVGNGNKAGLFDAAADAIDLLKIEAEGLKSRIESVFPKVEAEILDYEAEDDFRNGAYFAMCMFRKEIDSATREKG